MPSSARATTEIYTLPLHDALPICAQRHAQRRHAESQHDQALHGPDPAHESQTRSEEHTSELQSLRHLVCRLLLGRPPRSTLFPYTTLFRSVRSGTPSAAMQKASTIRLSMAPTRRTNRRPSFRLVKMLSPILSDRKRMVSISRDTTGARNDSVLRAKHQVSPHVCKTQPASAGPTITAALNWMEFRAIAFGMCSFGTSVGISAE